MLCDNLSFKRDLPAMIRPSGFAHDNETANEIRSSHRALLMSFI